MGLWSAIQGRNQSTAIEELKWQNIIAEISKQDSVTPDTGVIQFIKNNTFSITFSNVVYKSDGLYLKGTIGNAEQVYVNGLTLRFTATKQIGDMRPDYDKAKSTDKEVFFWTYPNLGTAQAPSIPSLPPGGTADFEVTIPNVHQTKDGVRIEVLFGSERYSFAP
jgi:hypothetical protein